MAYTPKQIADALRRTRGAIHLAAEALGCSHSTIYNWARRSPMVQEVIDQERGKLLDIGELKLYEAVMAGQPWAVAFMLKTIGKSRGYTEKTETENTFPQLGEGLAGLLHYDRNGQDAPEALESATYQKSPE